jgi:hypothetical protein
LDIGPFRRIATGQTTGRVYRIYGKQNNLNTTIRRSQSARSVRCRHRKVHSRHVDGVLIYLGGFHKSHGNDLLALIVAPQSLKDLILKSYHTSSLAGHFGYMKTYRRIRNQYFLRLRFSIQVYSTVLYRYCSSSKSSNRPHYNGSETAKRSGGVLTCRGRCSLPVRFEDVHILRDFA